MSRRTQRFGRQGAEDGNRNFSKKLSIDELLKSAVCQTREGEKERERVHCISFLQNIGGSEEAVVAWHDHKLEGTSQSLEKQYLRLTSVSQSRLSICTNLINTVVIHIIL